MLVQSRLGDYDDAKLSTEAKRIERAYWQAVYTFNGKGVFENVAAILKESESKRETNESEVGK